MSNQKTGRCTRQCNFAKDRRGVDYCKSCGMSFEPMPQVVRR